MKEDLIILEFKELKSLNYLDGPVNLILVILRNVWRFVLIEKYILVSLEVVNIILLVVLSQLCDSEGITGLVLESLEIPDLLIMAFDEIIIANGAISANKKGRVYALFLFFRFFIF